MGLRPTKDDKDAPGPQRIHRLWWAQAHERSVEDAVQIIDCTEAGRRVFITLVGRRPMGTPLRSRF